MSISRYSRTTVYGVNSRYGTSFTIPVIRENVELGNIRFSEYVSKERERLDVLAGQVYGDAKLWWIIAAASDIGFSPQVPPGIVLKIPNLEDLTRFVG